MSHRKQITKTKFEILADLFADIADHVDPNIEAHEWALHGRAICMDAANPTAKTPWTPGDWIAQGLNVCMNDSENEIVAECYPGHEIEAAEAVANAQFIATLPRLYHAAKAARETIIKLLNELDPAWHTQFDGEPEALTLLNKIITKIEGA